MKPKITIKQGGAGTINWGNGHGDSFEYPAQSAQNALGITRENLQAAATHEILLGEDEAARFFIAGGYLQYE